LKPQSFGTLTAHTLESTTDVIPTEQLLNFRKSEEKETLNIKFVRGVILTKNK